MAREESFFDDLARGLAEGTLSRGNGPRKLAKPATQRVYQRGSWLRRGRLSLAEAEPQEWT